MKPIWYRSAHELRALLASGEITSAELTRIFLDRIAKLDGKQGLNAVAEPDPTAAAQAEEADRRGLKGPLAGLPFLIKDNIDVAGLHTTAGSAALRDNIARTDAPAVAALRKAGAVILGKTNMTEFANFTTNGMPGGYSSLGGQVRHAYDPARNPSGSSSGSAVAVSAGLCAAALGTDTSFSVVGCATEHGICGFKPRMGALPQEGVVPLAHTLDSVGILARDMRDVTDICYAMRGVPAPDIAPLPAERMKLAVNSANRAMTSPAQLTRYARFLKKLRDAGVTTDRVRQMPTPLMRTVMTCEFAPDLEKYLASSGCGMKTLKEIVAFYRARPDLTPYGITLLEAALEAQEDPDKTAYARIPEERARLREAVLRELEGYDACLVTGPTNICHFIGIPSVSVPFCMGRDGRPRSVILYGADEERLLAAAMTAESFAGEIRPPAC